MNIALVHDPVIATPLSGTTPLVLAGHIHRRQIDQLPEVPGQQPTTLMVQGSTGGAGLRGLEGEEPTPLTMTVLYFDQEKQLQAYDNITVGGTGQAQVNLERTVINPPPTPLTTPPPTTPTPTPTR